MVAVLYAKLYWTLLVSVCVMGLCLAFAQPVFSVPDEGLHWHTVHYRLEHWLGVEGCVPTLTGGRCDRQGGPCAAIPSRALVCVEDPQIYGGLFTYPGVLLSKLVLPRQLESGVRQAQALLLSRLLQGLLVMLCLVRAGVVAMRAQRRGALVLAAFMLSPLVAQQTFAISADSGQLAFGACLFVAIVAWERLQWFDLVLFSLFGFSATAKPTILPSILPALLAAFWYAALREAPSSSAWDVVKRLIASLKPQRHPSVQTCMLWSGLALTVLTIAFSLHLDATNSAIEAPSPRRIANQNALLADPWLLLRLVLRQHDDPLRASTWVGPLGWLDARMPRAVANSFAHIVLLMVLLELAWLGWLLYRERPSVRSLWSRWRRLLPPLCLGLLGPLVNVAFVCAVMYVLWSPAGATRPLGTQFRYFFPAIMVCIGLIARALDGLPRDATAQVAAPLSLGSSRKTFALGIALSCLVLSQSLPLVARVFVALSERYHDSLPPH